jgi:serine/threonine-protein kinase
LPVHLKSNPQAKQRFLREAQSAAGLNHPNIVSIYDIVEQGDEEFIAMEYIEGKSLRQVLKEGKRLELEQIIDYVRKIAQALQVAHDAGVIHRDIKPDNLIITKSDEIKITDFGIAHIEESTITSDTMMIGTPFYMSPEQIKGKRVDRRTDIYSLGIVFYEMLTGKPPFTEGDIAYQHVHTIPPPPSIKSSGIPKEIDPIVMKCIAKEPDERYQTTMELADALNSVF